MNQVDICHHNERVGDIPSGKLSYPVHQSQNPYPTKKPGDVPRVSPDYYTPQVSSIATCHNSLKGAPTMFCGYATHNRSSQLLILKL